MKPTDVCYYDHVKQELKGSQVSKARKFCKLGLVKKIEEFQYAVEPIKGYNKRTYVVVLHDGGWHCNCQFHHQTGYFCSHIIAVMIWRRTRENVGV